MRRLVRFFPHGPEDRASQQAQRRSHARSGGFTEDELAAAFKEVCNEGAEPEEATPLEMLIENMRGAEGQ